MNFKSNGNSRPISITHTEEFKKHFPGVDLSSSSRWFGSVFKLIFQLSLFVNMIVSSSLIIHEAIKLLPFSLVVEPFFDCSSWVTLSRITMCENFFYSVASNYISTLCVWIMEDEVIPSFHPISLKCKIYAILLVKTACLCWCFLIVAVQISIECEMHESKAGNTKINLNIERYNYTIWIYTNLKPTCVIVGLIVMILYSI